MKKTNILGFTLIELLIVVAIIGILTAIVATNMAGARSKARDSKRVSDIGQIQLALELFYDRCKTYPSAITNPTSGIACSANPAITLDSYISQIPTPPTGTYGYFKDTIPATDYVLSAQLENYNEALKDGVQYNNRFGTAVCTDATTAPFYYCVGPR